MVTGVYKPYEKMDWAYKSLYIYIIYIPINQFSHITQNGNLTAKKNKRPLKVGSPVGF